LTGARKPNPNQLKAMAEQLNCSVHWLLTGNGPIEPASPGISQVPLLDIEEVGDFDINLLHKIAADKDVEFVSTGKDIGDECSPNSFAVILKDSSMSPVFQEGDYIFINPDSTPSTGAVVLAAVKGYSGAILRDYIEGKTNKEGNKSFTLVAREEGWPEHRITKRSKSNRIIGIFCGVQRPATGFIHGQYRLDSGD
jgi:hypothetical protein